MSGFLLRIIINAIIVVVVVVRLPGIFIDTLGSTLVGAAIIGIVNAALRPLMLLAAMPLNWYNLGWITFTANIVTLLMVVNLLPGYQISSMTSSFGSILLMTACSCALSKAIDDR